MSSTTNDWRERVRKKSDEAEKIPNAWVIPKDVRDSAHASAEINVLSVPGESGILSKRELEITETYDAVAMLDKIRRREFTSYEVTLAFCKRAAIAHQLVNCLTETFFQKSLKRARSLDDYLAREGKVVGPFHGLPISVKDTFNIKGVPTTIGYISFIGPPADSDSSLISLLEEQGAVLYVKTNIPQTLFAPDSNNNVFGRTLNPYNLTLTAGGSSGGEGALAAMRGSILGVGSDMAGSIRIPSLCNGTFGFKPTEHRIPYDNQGRPDCPGLFGPIFPVAGPMGRSARDMALFMRNVLNGRPYELDFMSPPLPWRPVVQSKSLRIGLIPACPSCAVTNVVRDTIRGAARLLEQHGHTVLKLRDFPNFKRAHDISYEIFDVDNRQTGLRHITDSGEPMVPATEDLNPDFPHRLRRRELEDLFSLNVKRQATMKEWHSIFNSNKLDVLLLPGGASTAPAHDVMRSAPYQVMWNLVNYPAAIIPIGGVLGESHIDIPEQAAGALEAPSHLQLVTRTFCDEELALALEIVSGVLNKPEPGPNRAAKAML